MELQKTLALHALQFSTNWELCSMPDFNEFLNDAVVADTLIKSGWESSRSIDMTSDISRLIDQGFQPNRHSDRILRSFGNLTIKRPTISVSGAKYGASELEFQPFDEADGFYPRLQETLLPLVGENLFPLGSADGIEILFAGESGRIYGDGIQLVLLRGQSFEEAMIQFIKRQEYPKTLWALTEHHRPWWERES